MSPAFVTAAALERPDKLVFLLFLAQSLWRVSAFSWRALRSFLRVLLRPCLITRCLRYGPLTVDSSVMHSVLGIVYLGLNGSCLLHNVSSSAALSSRAAMLALANIVPLVIATSLNVSANLISISLSTQKTLHRWMLAVTLFHSLLHTSVELLRRWFGSILAVTYNRPVIMYTGVCMISLCAISAHHMGRYFLRRLGQSLTGMFLSTLWYHTDQVKSKARATVLSTSLAWSGLLLLQNGMNIYRNWSERQVGGRTVISTTKGITRLAVIVPRDWRVRPEQSVLLWLPGISLTDYLFCRPLTIAFWDFVTRAGVQRLRIHFLIQQPSEDVQPLVHTLSPSYRWWTWICGPYGQGNDFTDHGTVILVATGTGIVPHLGHVKAILDAVYSCNTYTRRVAVLWQVQKEAHIDWLDEQVLDLSDDSLALRHKGDSDHHQSSKQTLLQNLVQHDHSCVVSWQIFVAEPRSRTRRSNRLHGHPSKRTGADPAVSINYDVDFDIVSVLSRETEALLSSPQRSMAVSVSADCAVHNTVNSWYTHLDATIASAVHLFKPEYQPR